METETLIRESVTESSYKTTLPPSGLVTVRRIQNPNSFSRSWSEVNKLKGPDGKVTDTTPLAYNEDVLPGSRDIFKPLFSMGRRMRLINITMEDRPYVANTIKEEDFKELVKKAKLTYEEGPNVGKIIEEASLYNDKDPFFSSVALERTHLEGDLLLDMSQPVDTIVYYCMLAHDEYALDGRINEKAIPSRVKYVLLHEGQSTDDNLNKVSVSRKLMKVLDNMNRQEAARIAFIFNIKIDNNTTDEMIKDQIALLLEDKTKTVPGLGKTYKEWFESLIQNSVERLSAIEIVHKGLNYGIIQKTRSGYMFEGEPLGQTKVSVESYLLDPRKQDIFARLSEALRFKEMDHK